jgi:hypothetical protein
VPTRKSASHVSPVTSSRSQRSVSREAVAIRGVNRLLKRTATYRPSLMGDSRPVSQNRRVMRHACRLPPSAKVYPGSLSHTAPA